MRIAIDLQGFQSEGSRTRGIGRYSYELIKNLILYHPENEYILFTNASLLDVRNDFNKELSNINVHYFKWYSPSPLDYLSNDLTTSIISKTLRTYAINLLNVDLFLITSFFEGFSDNCSIDLKFDSLNCAFVSISYDLIPYLSQDLYLKQNPDFSNFYLARLEKLRNLSSLLAISASSASEVIQCLSIDPKKVYNISSGCDEEIFNENDSQDYLSTLDINNIKPYIFYAGACDPRKNLRNLLRAYSNLSLDLLLKYKLVLAGKLFESEKELINRWIKEFNLNKKNIILLGYVSDTDLAILYRNCELFVFPSLHEGFGLPVLEAMSCGAPSIGSNRTSIPEVIGRSEALFDPECVTQITQLIEKALTDTSFKDFLISNSRQQRQNFSWKITSDKSMEAFREIVDNYSSQIIYNDWETIKEKTSHFSSNIIDDLINDKVLRKHSNTDLINLTSASIDLINYETRKLCKKYSKNKLYDNLSWHVEGPFDSNYSLAILNRYFVEGLLSLNNKVSLHITEGDGDYIPDIKFLSNLNNIHNIFLASKEKSFKNEIISRNLYPPRVSDMNGVLNLLHAYGWEESEFPSQWVNEFNHSLDGITVMSSFVKKILIDNGVTIPIAISGLGIDHIDTNKKEKLLNSQSNKFKFLHISSCFPRKGIDIILRAYGKEFTNNDNVILIIKTFDNPHNQVQNILDDLIKSNSSFPNVEIIKENLSINQIQNLYKESNVLLAPSRGEGFGLPIAEAMLFELPVITTNWGGQTDFCNSENSWLLDYTFVRSSSHFNLEMSYWAEPSEKHLSVLMRELYDLDHDSIKTKTLLAKKNIKKFTWNKVASINHSFAKKILKPIKRTHTRIGWLTTWQTRCGIASYSKYLIESIDSPVYIFKPFSEDQNLPESEYIIPSWSINNAEQNFDYLCKQILDLGITSLVIQFNYGFFEFSELSNLIDSLSDNNVKILLFMHSTIDPSNSANKKLVNILDSLNKCDRIMVHSIDDINRLKKLNLVNNVSIFSHGFLDYEPHTEDNKIKQLSLFKPFVKQRINIASYGFCLPQKGFPELISAVKILHNKGLNVYLNLFTAKYSKEYDYIYDELENLIQELDLEKLVSINKNYMSDEDVIDHLSNNDLIVFPYQNSNESSSAAVRQGISSLKPVLVTPLKIFDDVSNFVIYLKGCSPDEIANSIYQLNEEYLRKRKSLSKILHIKENLKYKRHSKLARRLLSIIKSLEING